MSFSIFDIRVMTMRSCACASVYFAWVVLGTLSCHQRLLDPGDHRRRTPFKPCLTQPRCLRWLGRTHICVHRL